MKVLSFLIFLFTITISIAQEIDGVEYLFPINPGQQNYLAGTVGEIRYSHFHTGIDVKTGGTTGLPVYATADGYVARVKVSPTGYGNTIYMQHPNGTFSVYAHLQSFDPKISKWILEQQYQKEEFAVDLFPKKDQFTFKRGDVIAFSGNTGSSSGPHLHFEIRDPQNNPIDVLSLGFDEIKDTRAPIVKKIAFATLSEDARVNGYFGRHEFDLSKKGDFFSTSFPVHLTGKIGIEIYSYDPMNDIYNKNGIVRTELFVDGKIEFREYKEKFQFSKQRSTLVHYNYEASRKGSKRFNKLYISDGNEQSFYQVRNGGVTFKGQNQIEIKTTDSYENTSVTRIELSKEIPETKPWISEVDRTDNFLHLRSTQSVSVKLKEWKSLQPYKSSGDDKYFIWDLRKGLPSAIFINGETIQTNFSGTIPPNQDISYHQKEFELSMTRRSLFDTLYLAFEKKYDSARNLELFHFKNQTDPLRSSIDITLKSEKEYHIDAAVFAVWGRSFGYQGGDWTDNSITFSSRDLATYTILRDTVPPTISPRIVNRNDLNFRIKDALSGIKSFKGELNGEFVLMEYEPKRNLIWSKKMNKNIPFEGEFILEVTDNSNNVSTYKRTL